MTSGKLVFKCMTARFILQSCQVPYNGKSYRGAGRQVFLAIVFGILLDLLNASRWKSRDQKMYPNALFRQRTLHFLLHILISSHKNCFAQSITAITQAPGYTSLASCAQDVAKAVIDDSTSPECPAGSPPSCFCENEGLSKGYSNQISTNILNNCLTSSRPQATSAASVFAVYCSLG